MLRSSLALAALLAVASLAPPAHASPPPDVVKKCCLSLEGSGDSAPPSVSAAPTFSHGPMLPALRVGFDSSGKAVTSVITAPGYSANLNLLPDAADPSVRWLSLFAFGSTGVGPGALGGNSAFDLTVGAGVGIKNNLLRLAVGYELLDVGLDGNTPSSGALISPHKANLVIFVATGVNIDTSNKPTMGAVRYGEPAPESRPPLGYVRL